MTQSDGTFFRQIETAERYSSCRPSYPRELLECLANLAPSRSCAWDCGTGNGQAARPLAEFFERVVATDHSPEQIQFAAPITNVEFRVAEAEQSGLEEGTIDLVVAAQAVHWFDLPTFYAEASRVLKPNGVIAIWCYRRPRVDSRIDRIVYALWQCMPRSKPLQMVEAEYADIPFPFAEESLPPFAICERWGYQRFANYLRTWKWIAEAQAGSAAANRASLLYKELAVAWAGVERAIRWELFLRVGRIDRV